MALVPERAKYTDLVSFVLGTKSRSQKLGPEPNSFKIQKNIQTFNQKPFVNVNLNCPLMCAKCFLSNINSLIKLSVQHV